MLFLTTSKHFRKIAVMAGLVLVASFLPIFINSADAAFMCVYGGFGGNINDCGPGDAGWGDKTACEDYCKTKNPVNYVCITLNASECRKLDTPTRMEASGVKNAVETAVNWAVEKVLETIVEIVRFINSYLVRAVAWAGGLMDAAINIAMAPLQGVGTIDIGWRITRDVANVFFIFILLTIAIATILRIERYGAKALLARLIIVALLINFSLVIAQAVVDASNVLGITFVSKIHPVSDKIAAVLEIGKLRSLGTGAQPKVANVPFSVAPGTLSAAASQNVAFANRNEPLDAASQNKFDVLAKDLFFELMIFIFLLLVIFVFLGLAILFIIRTVALMIIFILAPLGFLFIVLPSTQKYGSEWWHSLFSWSFFFPASTFMLYLAISFGYELRNINFAGNQATNQGLAFATITMICLLMGSLIVARKMGIYGASGIMNFGNKLQGRARGYLGKGLRYATVGAAGAAGGYAARGAARTLGPSAGRAAEWLGEKGTLGKFTAKPFAWYQQVGAKQTKDKEKYKEKYWEDALDRGDSAFKAARAATVTAGEQAYARKAAIKKGKGHLLTDDELRAEYDTEKAKVKPDLQKLRNIENINPLLTSEGITNTADREEANARAASRVTETSIREGRLRSDFYNNPEGKMAMLLGFGTNQMRASLETAGDIASNAVKDGFQELTVRLGGADKALEAFEEANSELVKSMLSNAGIGKGLKDVKDQILAILAARGESVGDYKKRL